MKFKSIRPFIGAKDFETSRQFYLELDFKELPLRGKISFFQVSDSLGFYLQNAYVKDWVDNSMLFLEVKGIEAYLEELKSKDLPSKYKGVRLSEIVINDWGKEFFLHDPSGILWHFGSFTD